MITLITPTGGRPDAFALCQKWMARQSYKGDIEWLVVDDVEPETEIDGSFERSAPNRTVRVLRPEPLWKVGDNTQSRNLILAAREAKGDFIFIIEDDDWYAPNYLSYMVELLQENELVGEGRAWYYHIPRKRYMRHSNMHHASLCQTAFRKSILHYFIRSCETRERFIDLHFWKAPVKRKIFYNQQICIGIKGLPGREGIGQGHLRNENMHYRYDGEHMILFGLIGEADADEYRKRGLLT